MEGFKWDFAPADAPWQNGVSEVLVKSVKQAITAAISDHVMTFSELQTVCFEVAITLLMKDRSEDTIRHQMMEPIYVPMSCY